MPRKPKVEPINTDLRFHRWNLWSLIILLMAEIYGLSRIASHDMRLLFSLGMIIGSGVGRYGSIMASKLHPLWKHPLYEGYRDLVYKIMFLVGVVGLIL